MNGANGDSVQANATESLPRLTADSNAEERRAAVDAFLLICNEMGSLGARIFRRHIWEDAGHGKPRQFQFWQARDPKATKSDDENFRRILADPSGFMARIREKHPK